MEQKDESEIEIDRKIQIVSQIVWKKSKKGTKTEDIRAKAKNTEKEREKLKQKRLREKEKERIFNKKQSHKLSTQKKAWQKTRERIRIIAQGWVKK